MFYATGLTRRQRNAAFAPDSEAEERILRNQAEALQSQLDAITERLAKLEADKKE